MTASITRFGTDPTKVSLRSDTQTLLFSGSFPSFNDAMQYLAAVAPECEMSMMIVADETDNPYLTEEQKKLLSYPRLSPEQNNKTTNHKTKQ